MTGRSYRLGILLVLGTVALSAVVIGSYLAFGSGGRPQPAAPAGQDLGTNAYPLEAFSLIERSGKSVQAADLADRVWIAAFIFTRCKASCPRISTTLKGIQDQLAMTGVRLVSISVDPEHDTPAILSDYAKRFGADPDRWWFLTGQREAVYDLILHRFKVSVAASSEADQQKGAEAVAHSDRLALVGPGNRVIGLFDSNDAAALKSLVEKARTLDGTLQRPWLRTLPAVNATLNGTCAVLLLTGWMFIRNKKWKAHAVCMIGAVVVSAIFLTCYLVYHFHAGSKPFVGPTAPRFVYLTILLSHTLLATFGVVPYVIATLYRAIRRDFARHAKIAAVTLPIWTYVSVTGVVIYWMLYQMSFPIATMAG